MLKTLFRFRNFVFIQRNELHTIPANLELPLSVLPQNDNLEKLNKFQKEKIAKRIVELEFLYSLSDEVPKVLTWENWVEICDIPMVREREFYIRNLYFNELNKEKCEQSNIEKNINFLELLKNEQSRFDNGEMVYGSSFYNLYSCFKGADFRKMIDRLYGSNFWKSERLNDPLPKLIIDCRDLYKSPNLCVQSAIKQIEQTYEMNWSSKSPFEIIIANFFVSDVIDRAIKKHWYFLFGPPSSQNSENCENIIFENDSVSVNNQNKYIPITFIPTITTRGIWGVLGEDVKPDEVVYISSKAKTFLDTVLVDKKSFSDSSKKNLKIKAFVISAYDNPNIPWQHSISAAIADKIPSFRLPYEKYIIFDKKRKPPPIYTIASILRFVNNQEYSWDYTIKHHFGNKFNKIDNTFTLEGNSLRLALIEKRKRRVQLLEEIEQKNNLQLIKNFDEHKTIKNLSNTKTIFKQKTRTHKYSREERNQMRKQNNFII